ncbi:uncharacterized protein TNCV_4224461 [Trichonephila clavipes]|nr:uncharacterized protein TNCV_4224461 [Trichonephila clavipes]
MAFGGSLPQINLGVQELNTRIRPLGLPHQRTIGISVLVLEAHGFKRQDQTLLARVRSGHLNTMKFSEGYKNFEMCANCSSEPASHAHILECLGLTKQDLAGDPLLVLDFLKVFEVRCTADRNGVVLQQTRV